MAKVSKASVGYHENAHADRCGVCKYFQAPNGCAIVSGVVAADGWCERFKRMASKWISGATENAHGQFRKKAEKAGMTTAAYAKKEEHAPGKLGSEARLAENLMGLHNGGAKPRNKRETLFNRSK